jgi:hypothetical protein
VSTETDIGKLEASGVHTPEHLLAYVEVLGIDGALAFFLGVGGSQIYLPKKSSDRTLAAQTVGAENVERLAELIGYGYIKVPLARQWVAQVMRSQGKSDNEIARTVRADVSTVRRWVRPNQAAQQLSLL